jgi:hypothetical protein
VRPKKVCKVCNVALTDQEAATYGGRCEDCWSAGTDERLSGVFINKAGDAAPRRASVGRKAPAVAGALGSKTPATRRLSAYHKNPRATSSAAVYSKDLVGELRRITNQGLRRL